MNKYQESLNTLTDYFHSYAKNGVRIQERHVDENYLKAKEILQDMVDNYPNMEKELDKAHKVITHMCWKECLKDEQ